jgi:23S rRNA (adenine2503-C2)-methyltransferase
MNIFGATLADLRDYFRNIDENPAKAELTFDGIYRRGLTDFAEIGFSERVSAAMERDFSPALPEIVEAKDSADTAKLLLKLEDGEFAETVLMRQKFGAWVCVSTQVGCAMGCAFCQSGRMKKKRNLAAHEIVGQVMAVAKRFDVKISGVSVMGIGEPFDNFGAVRDFCEIICAAKGLALGEKHVTVSTCGIVPKIYKYATLPHPCNLAISLHAPNGELRSRLMPINKVYPLCDVIAAAEHFSQTANRRVTLEYIMLKGVNDTPELAEELAKLIGEKRFYVNIIPYNSTDSCFEKSDRERIMRFYDVLKKRGIGVTMRREFGSELKAACGQLRADYCKETK